MKLVMLSLGISLLAYAPCFAIPRDRTNFNNINGYYQVRPVTGKVTDNNNVPLPGVTITAKGTQRSTVTNEEGSFSIDVPAGVTILVFSYTGMQTQEITIGNAATFSVQLKPSDAT